MVNGRYYYDLTMTTPLGKRKGALELAVEDNFVNGVLTMFARAISLRKGRLEGHNICFEGDIQVFQRNIPYRANGAICKNDVYFQLATDQGNYPVVGKLSQARRL